MSIVPKETIEVIAQSIGISDLSPEVALSLAPDVEYRMREIMQEAIKCMRHSRRTTLTTDDVDAALNLRNVEPIYGYASRGPLEFKKAIGYKDLFYIDNKDIDFKDIIEAPLPKAPLDTAIVCHWLAIDGVQPAIPENAPVEVIAPPPESKSYEQKDGPPVDLKLPVKHVLSRELQLYFDKITELILSKSDSILFKQALASLATDSGLHPLIPYFTYFIADEVSRSLSDCTILFALMRVVSSLLQNPHIHIEPYLHQLMPSVVTCLVAKRLGNRFADNHWELRDFTAKLVAVICKRFGHVYNSLQTRLTKTLVNALLDPRKALTQQYGAIQGLAALGPNVPYLQLLEPELLLEKQKNEMKRSEAWRVYGALVRAAGQCMHDRLKIFPPIPSPPAHTAWKTNAKVITAGPNKRKASIENLEEQPPLKKRATDGPTGEMPSDTSPTHMQTEAAGDRDAGQPSSEQSAKGTRPGKKIGRDGNNNRAVKMPAVLNQVWKEELNSGRLLVTLFDQFGEGILPFVPAPEMSLFF
ncbi:hypothetical protein ACFE04_001717 [Oxalis oulophora]